MSLITDRTPARDGCKTPTGCELGPANIFKWRNVGLPREFSLKAAESSRGAGQSPSRLRGRNARPVALPPQESKTMIRRKPTYFRNSLDLRDKVQVKVLRRRLKVSDEQFADIFRKSGNSISAITKEAERAASTSAGVQL